MYLNVYLVALSACVMSEIKPTIGGARFQLYGILYSKSATGTLKQLSRDSRHLPLVPRLSRHCLNTRVMEYDQETPGFV